MRAWQQAPELDKVRNKLSVGRTSFGSKPKGDADECSVMANTVEADRCYLMDRGCAKLTFWNGIHAVQSS